MSRPQQHTAPFELSRRAFAAGIAVSLLLAGSGDAAETQAIAPMDPTFLRLSQALIGHPDLDPVTSARISQAFGQLFPKLKADFPKLDGLAAEYSQPRD